MVYHLEIHGRTIGKIFEVSEIIRGEAKLFQQRIGAPSRLEFTLLKDFTAAYHEGDPVLLSVDGLVVFTGFVFRKRKNDKGEIATVCYDQLRYLKAHQTYNWENYSLADAVEQIMTDFQLNSGDLPDTGYRLPYGHYQDMSLLDIIADYQAKTTIATGVIWNFFDEAGLLVLRRADEMQSRIVIGENSLGTGYDYETSIDKDTYNQIKLVRPNEETGRADIYMAISDETIAKWGLLQLYEIVDENLNAAQIEEMARNRLTYHNRVFRNLTLKSVGVASIRAGSMVMIDLPELGDISLQAKLLIDKATHTFGSSKHDMALEMQVIL
ncbi:MAG: hypothetical protein FWE76_01895 [Symbiobacteriaceae bacterium]|nr:hypothetical protein [Symbiobacteriaceae bacterium]